MTQVKIEPSAKSDPVTGEGQILDQAMLLSLKMTIRLAAALFLALVQPAGAFQVKRVTIDAGVVLRLRGDVRAGDYARLKALLQEGEVVGLEISSGGGSLEDGVDIARLVRDKGLVVYASEQCDSVCAFIFFAAKERFLGRGCRIGVHSVSNDRGREDADSARVTLQVSRFLSGAGVPHSIIGKIVATPPARITFLDNRDLAGLNVQRNNPFRKGHDLAGAIGSPKPEAVCDVNVATEPPAHAAHRSCVAPAPQVSQAP